MKVAMVRICMVFCLSIHAGCSLLDAFGICDSDGRLFGVCVPDAGVDTDIDAGEGVDAGNNLDVCANNGPCLDGRVCRIVENAAVCGDCPAGFDEKDAVGCADIDECAVGVAGCIGDQICINRLGSFTCDDPNCSDGFVSVNGSCVPDPNECSRNNGGCVDGRRCQETQTFIAATNGTFQCGACPDRFIEQGAFACVDIDECRTNNGNCGSPQVSVCINNEGAPPTCQDINECLNNNGNCGNAQFFSCTNNIGLPPTCKDIDECANNNGGCGDIRAFACQNQVGATPLCQSAREFPRWPTPIDPLENNYQDNGDGTITDRTTGLMWEKNVIAAFFTQSDAIIRCNGLILGNQSDWRLPSTAELLTLVNRSRANPASAFPFMSSEGYWSSTPLVGDATRAWLVAFFSGNASFDNITFGGRVRCVR